MIDIRLTELYILGSAMQDARKKHPVFADNFKSAILAVMDELGEICHAIDHNEGQDRIDSEILDLRIVVERLFRQEWTGGDFDAFMARLAKSKIDIR